MSIYNDSNDNGGGGGGSGWLDITSECTIGSIDPSVINPAKIVTNGVSVLYNESVGLLKFDLKMKAGSYSGNVWNRVLIIPNYIKFNAKQYAFIFPRASYDYQYYITVALGICTNNFGNVHQSEKNDFSTNELQINLSSGFDYGFIISGIFTVEKV